MNIAPKIVTFSVGLKVIIKHIKNINIVAKKDVNSIINSFEPV